MPLVSIGSETSESQGVRTYRFLDTAPDPALQRKMDVCRTIYEDNLAEFRELLPGIEDVNTTKVRILLNLAIKHERIEMVQDLIDMDARLDIRDKSGRHAFHYACFGENVPILRILLLKLIHSKSGDDSMKSSKRKMSEFERILKSGDRDKLNGLMLANKRGNDKIVEELLLNPDWQTLKRVPDLLNCVDIRGESALFHAINNKRYECMMLLLQSVPKMVDVDHPSSIVDSSPHSSQSQSGASSSSLCATSAETDKSSALKTTCLMSEEEAKIGADAGDHPRRRIAFIDLNLATSKGNTVLMLATLKEDLKAVKIVLNAAKKDGPFADYHSGGVRLDINVCRSELNKTALMIACHKGLDKIAEELLSFDDTSNHLWICSKPKLYSVIDYCEHGKKLSSRVTGILRDELHSKILTTLVDSSPMKSSIDRGGTSLDLLKLIVCYAY